MKIVPIKERVNADAVEILKDAIKRVEAGEITGITLSWITDEGEVSGEWSSSPNNILMWSAIKHIEISFYNDVVIGDKDG